MENRTTDQRASGDPGGNERAGDPTLRWSLQVGVITLIFAVALFLSAGSLGWLAAWIYVGVLVLNQALTALLVIRHNPELAQERSQVEAAEIARWDRPLAGLMAVFGPLATLLVAGLDRRLGWSPETPFWLQAVALGAILLGSLWTTWAMTANRFFYGHVRVEEARGHRVVSSGPYRRMRHPGYAGASLFYLATPFTLGSLWALIPAALTVGVIVVRTALEDRLLQAELSGYQDYVLQVRYRLLPGVW